MGTQEVLWCFGFFNLQTQFDLREKLHRELDKLRAAPRDVDAALTTYS